MPKSSLKVCRCGKQFEPITKPNSTIKSKYCIDCLVKKGKEKIHKELKKTVRENDRKTRARATRETCHYWVRERDKGKPCISCGRPDEGERHASHYFDSGQFSGLRYDETNIHASCSWCNTAKHGNKIGYRAGLVQRYGLPFVEALEAKKDTGRNKKWSTEELKEVELYYKEKIKSIKLWMK